MARRLQRRSVGGVLASSFDKKAVQLSPATPQLVLGDQHARFHVLILCGMHGDERDPIDAVNQLVRDGLFDAVDKAAKITLLLGNAQAVREGVAYIDEDLDHLIDPSISFGGEEVTERSSALKIAKIICTCDLILDLRSKVMAKDTSIRSVIGGASTADACMMDELELELDASVAPHSSVKGLYPSIALPAANKQSEFIAKHMPVEYVVLRFAHRSAKRATPVDWAFFRGKAAVRVECGLEGQRETIQCAKRVVAAVLTGSNIHKPLLLQAGECVTARDGFTFVIDGKEQPSLDGALRAVKHGEVIARDDLSGDIRCAMMGGAFVLPVHPWPHEGDDAFVWAALDDNHAPAASITGSPVQSPQFSARRQSASPFSSPIIPSPVSARSSGLLSVDNTMLVFGSEKAHVHVLITVAVHGNEYCGVDAVNELIKEKFFHSPQLFSSYRVAVILGNPRAYAARVRFVDENLNRVLSPSALNRSSYESQRAVAIADAIKECHVYLDVHSCSSPSPPFVLPARNLKSESLAQELPVSYVISNLAHTTPGRGTSMDWAYFHGKTGLCVECGQHDHPDSVQAAKKIIVALLTGKYKRKLKPRNVMQCNDPVMVRKDFSYTRRVEAFEYVEHGAVIAKDANGPLACPYEDGAYMVMPTSLPVIGEEAWFWGIHKHELDVEATPYRALVDSVDSDDAGLASRSSSGAEDETLPLPEFEPPLYAELARYDASRLTPESPEIQLGNSSASVKILVICAMDGDETCGLDAVNDMLADSEFDDLNVLVTFVLGNPEAVSQGTKCVQERLNRCISSIDRQETEPDTYEGVLARQLSRKISDSDIVLVFHSVDYECIPFVIPAPNRDSSAMARKLPVKCIVENLMTHGLATALDCAFVHRKTAVGIVCGQHTHASSVDVAKRVLRATILGAHELVTDAPIQQYRCMGYSLKTEGHTLCKNRAPFEFIEHGERVAVGERDGEVETCKYKPGAFVILPSTSPGVGDELWYWAARVEQNCE